jgi:prephenate dehydratase
MSASVEPLVAFQGEAGAYSQQAARQFFGQEVSTLACRHFADLFSAVQDGRASHAVLPVENSLAGTVVPAYDQLLDHDLRVQGEVIVRVEHCLLAPPGSELGTIRRAISHPQALAQCEQTLRRLEIEPVSHYDTAGAARDLAQRPEVATAAIASRLAAETYGLAILARGIEDLPYNYTRFFILGEGPVGRAAGPSKTSIIFTTRHMPGALYAVLGELAQRQLNMTKIESRPRRNRPWHYLFYLDFEGHEEEPTVREALLGILSHTTFLKILGSYPAAPPIPPAESQSPL